MKAMIFAAGLGTRLAPFTSQAPKALVPLGGKPMLQRVAEKLIDAGATTIVVNVHHYADQVADFLKGLNGPGVKFIISEESKLLLETGGGLKKAACHLGGVGPVILHNADVLSDIDLGGMVRQHLSSGAMATLAVSRRTSTRYFLWDEGGRLGGWENRTTGERIRCKEHSKTALEPMAFSGIHVIDVGLFRHFPEADVFSINQVYLRLAATHPVIRYVHDHRFWADIGTPDKLRQAEQLYQRERERFEIK
jgi:N-acetyl-alpha-D-muramate 1-phosphate uridylyltransferase